MENMNNISTDRLPFLKTDKLSYNSSSKTFVGEASDMGISVICTTAYHITNPSTGNKQTFWFKSHDLDEGDVMGWRYESNEGIKLLIIND